MPSRWMSGAKSMSWVAPVCIMGVWNRARKAAWREKLEPRSLTALNMQKKNVRLKYSYSAVMRILSELGRPPEVDGQIWKIELLNLGVDRLNVGSSAHPRKRHRCQPGFLGRSLKEVSSIVEFQSAPACFLP